MSSEEIHREVKNQRSKARREANKAKSLTKRGDRKKLRNAEKNIFDDIPEKSSSSSEHEEEETEETKAKQRKAKQTKNQRNRARQRKSKNLSKKNQSFDDSFTLDY